MPESTVPGALLLCLDMQALFLNAIESRDRLIRRCQLALHAAQGLGMTVAFTEQVPSKLGPTIDSIRAIVPEAGTFPKTTFSALADDSIAGFIAHQDIEHLIICGIETPICVYQTALDALNRDIAVTVLSDVIGARCPTDAAVVTSALSRHGAHVLPLESIFYALLHDADHPFFKSFTQLVKIHG
ncbi:MAG: isochorismatase family protein [Candidatus Synoicihabitans palmerolidicus]|nr:isochorismatase family protein [Candidatus Synoicihabitans palmerolidicus]